jgi:rhamnulokinase
MGVEATNPIINEQSLTLNFTNEGGIEGTFRFLKNIAGLWLLEECRRAWSKERAYSYEELMRASSSAKPFKAFIEPDSPEFLNPPDMPEAIRTYCGQTGQSTPDSAAEFVRCILESLALKYRFVLDQLRQVHHYPINRIHVIGGGSQNPTLCQFTANATGLSVIAGPAEATAIGNLMVQALSTGHISSLADMRRVIRHSFKLTGYEPERVSDWGKAYKRFRNVAEI